MSDIRVRRLRLGLDLGGAGNFPWTGGDGSLLAGGGPVAAGVLDATARTPGILSVCFVRSPVVLAFPVFPLPLLSSTPPAQGATIGVRPRPLPVRLGRGFLCRRLLLCPFILLVAFAGPVAFVSALYSLPGGGILLLVPPVLPFSIGSAGLLASWAPGALRHSRVLLPLGGLPRARRAVVSLPLSSSLSAHVLQGSAVALLCFSRARRALDMICPAFSGSHGTGRLGVAPACFPGVAAGAGGTLLVVVRELLSS